MNAEPLHRRHAPAMLRHLQDASIYAYIPGAPPKDLPALEVELDRLAAGSPSADQVWLNWAVAEGGEIFGRLQATLDVNHCATIGYIVFAQYGNRGLGRAAVSWLLTELFTRRGVERAQAFVDRRNEPSLRLLRRLGFTQLAPDAQPAQTPDTDHAFALHAEHWAI
jgi:[ribosomal protein S5]-alanine N-acetyltransferase